MVFFGRCAATALPTTVFSSRLVHSSYEIMALLWIKLAKTLISPKQLSGVPWHRQNNNDEIPHGTTRSLSLIQKSMNVPNHCSLDYCNWCGKITSIYRSRTNFILTYTNMFSTLLKSDVDKLLKSDQLASIDQLISTNPNNFQKCCQKSQLG